MSADSLFSVFITPSTIFICLTAYVMTYAIRRTVEGFWEGAKKNRYWTKVFVPLGPIMNGATLGLAVKTFMWPDIASTFWGRVFYGAVCGMFSSLVYGRVWDFVKTKTDFGKKEEEKKASDKKPEAKAEAKVEAKVEAKAEAKPAEKPAEPKK